MLPALERTLPPSQGWRIIAVNNGSQDDTGNILESYREKLPLLILNEDRRGKNFALNKAIDHANGDLLVFTDDDVVPDPYWLLNLEKCAANNPTYGIFGGAIQPKWPREPGEWLLNNVPLGMVFAVTDPSWQGAEVTPMNGDVWGPNMAIRKTVFDETQARFQTAVGPDGSQNYIMGSESELVKRLQKAGIKAWFCPESKVQHIIRENQLDIAWILRRFYRHGRSSYVHDHQKNPTAPRIFGMERWILIKYLNTAIKAYTKSLLLGQTAAFKEKALYLHTKGFMHQAWQSRHLPLLAHSLGHEKSIR